jgi:hypothetical protein
LRLSASSLTFSYLNSIMAIGRSRALEADDLPPLHQDDRAGKPPICVSRPELAGRRLACC